MPTITGGVIPLVTIVTPNIIPTAPIDPIMSPMCTLSCPVWSPVSTLIGPVRSLVCTLTCPIWSPVCTLIGPVGSPVHTIIGPAWRLAHTLFGLEGSPICVILYDSCIWNIPY